MHCNPSLRRSQGFGSLVSLDKGKWRQTSRLAADSRGELGYPAKPFRVPWLFHLMKYVREVHSFRPFINLFIHSTNCGSCVLYYIAAEDN